MKEHIYTVKIRTQNDALTPDQLSDVLGLGGLLINPNEESIEVKLVQIRDTDPREEG